MGTGKEDCGLSLTPLMQTQTTRLRRMRHGVWFSLCATAGIRQHAMSHCSKFCQGSREGPNAVPLPE